MDADLLAALAAIGPLDVPAMNWARQRHEQLTKPPGSLGRLEEIAIRLTGITGRTPPRASVKTVVVAAADHGVADEGVSAYPKTVTRQMVENIVRGGAAVSVLARGVGAKVVVVDAGVDADLSGATGVIDAKIRFGTGNMALGPAMTRDEAMEAIRRGIAVARAEAAAGAEVIATGDMGIGNTTPSSAITAVLARRAVADVTGRGTGITIDQLKTKIAVIERAIARNAPNPDDPIDVLHKVGGLEIALLVGVMIGAAGQRVPIVLDGFISGAAALVAAQLAPGIVPYLFAAHSSVEIGHR
ncbi:MAG: nicotinate-nucleotide--dimethylbenzimidazole phosphoribosyltransferase, partial [Dehalococcoidia bacterium]|nr:nicotinate-nucleotide--dimethylbenzimidazole phosphoribosyltransferase [Dehalococcoidia bacterium]